MEALKNFQEVEDWINTQRLVRWTISTDRVESGDKAGRIIVQTFKENDLAGNLAYTEQALRMAKGTRLYARGWRSEGQTSSPCYAEIYFAGESSVIPQQIQQMVGYAPSFNEEEMTEKIRKQVKAELQLEALTQREKELDRRERDLKDRENSAIGALAHYLAPVGQMILGKARVPMAGIETAGGDVAADRIVPTDAQAAEPAEDVFSDEEAAEIETLMERLKAAEPEYLRLLRRVVEMAEAHDTTYNMARTMLLQ